MKHRLWLLLAALLCLVPAQPGRAQPASTVAPPEVASYIIAARYDPDTHQLTGQETIRYTNRTDAAMSDLVFHLYLNAFRSQNTLWMQEAGPEHRGYTFYPTENGWSRIESLALADGTPLELDALDADETLVRAMLSQRVLPGETVTVNLAFTAQLPRVFARTGWADDGDFVMAGQWFPKPGVWEATGWNAYPFHANSEFFADFGDYDVAVTLPAGWVTGATGLSTGAPQRNADGTETHRFRAEHVIDFAWTASPHFREQLREVEGVTIRTLYYPSARATARRIMSATEGAFRLYSEWYGPYGMGFYPQLTVVAVPPDAGGAGGMEYPTLFTVGALEYGVPLPGCFKITEAETVHELGHQWFQSVVATNEAEDPWLDEGFTDYLTVRAMNALYDGAMLDCWGWNFSYLGSRRIEYQLFPDLPMAGAAWNFGPTDYGIAAYSKPATALSMLERTVGEEAMLRFMRAYYERYAFGHPDSAAVQAVMAETLGQETADRFFQDWVYGNGTLDWSVQDLGATEALIRRQGAACAPTMARLELRGAAPEERALPCDSSDIVVSADAPLLAVEIDSDQALLLDQNLVNNGLRQTPDWAAWLGLSTRMALFLQDFFLGGGALW